MKVIVKKAGKPAEIVDIDCKYRNELRKLISDEDIIPEYVEIVPQQLGMVVDEDGLPKSLPFNFYLATNNPYFPVQEIVGTVVFFRYKWENPFEKEIYDFEVLDVTEKDIELVEDIVDFEDGDEDSPEKKDGGGEIINYEVGRCYEEWKDGHEGFIIEWDNTAGFILYAKLKGISDTEKRQFDCDIPLEIRYTTIDDICYFLFRFGNMPWADCPFSPAIYKNVGRTAEFPKVEKNSGFGLQVLLIDTKSGELCKIRLIGLGHDFSKKWREWADKAAAASMPFGEYRKRICATYAKYTSIELAEKARNEGNGYVVK